MWPSDSIASIWRYRYQKLYLLVCVVMVGVEVVIVKWLKSIDRVSYLQRVSYVWRLPPRILAIMHEHETSTSNQKIWTKKYCGVDGKKEKICKQNFQKKYGCVFNWCWISSLQNLCTFNNILKNSIFANILEVNKYISCIPHVNIFFYRNPILRTTYIWKFRPICAAEYCQDFSSNEI